MDTETTTLEGAGARILRELIRTPKFREAVLILLKSIDPPAARQVVRTFFWEDAVLFMSVLGAAPELVNLFINAAAEALAQAGALPPGLLRDFIDRVAAGLDGMALGEAGAGCVNLLAAIGGDEDAPPMKGASKLKDDFSEAYRDGVDKDKLGQVRALFTAAGDAMASNPDFMENVLRPLFGPAISEIARSQAAEPRDEEGGSTGG